MVDNTKQSWARIMGLLPDTQNCGMGIRRDARNVFPTTAG